MVKAVVEQKTRDEMLPTHLIEIAIASGWYFRCVEASFGHYVAEGQDGWGRCVSRDGSEPEALLEQYAADARKINENG